MRLTSELFDELAAKEGLVFTIEEKNDLMAELNQMVSYIDKIREVNTADISPLAEIADFRSDPSIDLTETLSNNLKK